MPSRRGSTPTCCCRRGCSRTCSRCCARCRSPRTSPGACRRAWPTSKCRRSPTRKRTFAQLHERIARTLAFIDGLDPLLFEGADDRDVVLRPGTPKERRFEGKAYLLQYGLPQFFFHVTTAYALLRHNGVAVGKLDYMGAR